MQIKMTFKSLLLATVSNDFKVKSKEPRTSHTPSLPCARNAVNSLKAAFVRSVGVDGLRAE